MFLGAYFFTLSQKKLPYVILVLFFCFIALQLVPEEWFSRMNTIENADDDASFMGRVVAWKLSLILAIENPIFGGGIKSLELFPVWSSLSNSFDMSFLGWFYTGSAVPDTIRGHAAHSIYFQILGEQGFVGLALFLFILFSSLRRGKSIQQNKNAPVWSQDLALMLRLSILCYMLGGAALSFAYFDGMYAIIAILIALENFVKNQNKT